MQAHRPPGTQLWRQKCSINCCLSVVVVAFLLGVATDATAAAAAGPGAAAEVFEPCAFPGSDAAVQRFSKVLSFPTVSSAASDHHVVDASVFTSLDHYLADAYRNVSPGQDCAGKPWCRPRDSECKQLNTLCLSPFNTLVVVHAAAWSLGVAASDHRKAG